MADALMAIFDFTISRQAVADHLRAADWNVRAQSRAEPLLREDLGHFEARVAFGREHRSQTWRNWVDVDEKWFYTMALRLLLKLSRPTWPCRSAISVTSRTCPRLSSSARPAGRVRASTARLAAGA